MNTGEYRIDPNYFDGYVYFHRDNPSYYYTKFYKLAQTLTSVFWSSLYHPGTTFENEQERYRAENIRDMGKLLFRPKHRERTFGPLEEDKAIMLLALSLVTCPSSKLAQIALPRMIEIYPPDRTLPQFTHPIGLGKKVFEADVPLRCHLTQILPTWTELDLAVACIITKDLEKCGFTEINTRAIDSIVAANPSNSLARAPHTLRCIWSLKKESPFAKLPRDIAKVIIRIVVDTLPESLIKQIQDASRTPHST
jgi:hypothetical protein